MTCSWTASQCLAGRTEGPGNAWRCLQGDLAVSSDACDLSQPRGAKRPQPLPALAAVSPVGAYSGTSLLHACSGAPGWNGAVVPQTTSRPVEGAMGQGPGWLPGSGEGKLRAPWGGMKRAGVEAPQAGAWECALCMGFMNAPQESSCSSCGVMRDDWDDGF